MAENAIASKKRKSLFLYWMNNKYQAVLSLDNTLCVFPYIMQCDCIASTGFALILW